jgi:hypothetical protein
LQQQPDEPTPSDHKTTLKALLRSARALLGLEKLPEALDALERLRTLELDLNGSDSQEDVGKKWRETVQDKIRVKKGKELEKVEKERRTREGNESMIQALKVRLLEEVGVLIPQD